MSDGQVPPHDLDAEQAVLSACVMSPTAFDVVQGIALPEHCYSPSNRWVLEAVYDLRARGDSVDAVAIRGWLKSRGRLDEVGGAQSLLKAIEVSPAIANVRQHAETVRDKARLRKMINVCNRVSAEAYGDCGEVQQFLDAAEHEVFNVSCNDAETDVVPLSVATAEALSSIAAAAAAETKGVTGIRSGFDEVDRLTTGMHGGELFIVAGRPGMGKTSYVLGMAANIAKPERDDTPSENGVAFFSLEMPREQLVYRLLASEARVEVSRLRSGTLKSDDWTRLTDAATRLQRMPIWLDDTPALTLLALRSKVRRLQMSIRHGGGSTKRLGLVAVDYLQLMQGRRNAGNREQEISELSRGMKQLAKEAEVPLVALSQLNRSVEIRSKTDKRPQLSDLRESGAIEQDADTILFLYRDEYYFKDESVDRGIAEVIIAKQRNGPTATVKTKFTDAYTRFDNLARDATPDWAQPSGGIDDLGDIDAAGRDMRGGVD